MVGGGLVATGGGARRGALLEVRVSAAGAPDAVVDVREHPLGDVLRHLEARQPGPDRPPEVVHSERFDRAADTRARS